jgi:L-amino acid N-acyltransferase YncA
MKTEALKLPRSAALSDGTEITLRLLGRTDFEAFFAFTSSLPAHDLLFLRTDITNAAVLADWFDNLEAGRIVTVVGERDGKIVGYGSLHLSAAPWSQHVGELRVLIDGSMRGKGLGRALTGAVFAQALDRGIEKMVAQMTVDQKGAIATFEELGFKPEALLVDHVKDREGRKHDLLVYSHDVHGFHARMDAYGVSEAAVAGDRR